MLFFKRFYEDKIDEEWLIIPYRACIPIKNNSTNITNLKKYKQKLSEICNEYYDNLMNEIKTKIENVKIDSMSRKTIVRDIVKVHYNNWKIVLQQLSHYNNVINKKNIKVDVGQIDVNIIQILIYVCDFTDKNGFSKKTLYDMILSIFINLINKLTCVINRPLTIMEIEILLELVLEVRVTIIETWYNTVLLYYKPHIEKHKGENVERLKIELEKQKNFKEYNADIKQSDKIKDLSVKLENLLYHKYGN